MADRRGRPVWFSFGHANKGKSNTWLVREEVNRFTARERARKVVGRATPSGVVCVLTSIGGCSGRVEVHHVDEDPWNNDLANLRPLCTTHHRLVHQGRIDLENPVMPPYYVDGSGKRRYAHSGYALPNQRRSRSEASRAREERKRQNAGT